MSPESVPWPKILKERQIYSIEDQISPYVVSIIIVLASIVQCAINNCVARDVVASEKIENDIRSRFLDQLLACLSEGES